MDSIGRARPRCCLRTVSALPDCAWTWLRVQDVLLSLLLASRGGRGRSVQLGAQPFRDAGLGRELPYEAVKARLVDRHRETSRAKSPYCPLGR